MCFTSVAKMAVARRRLIQSGVLPAAAHLYRFKPSRARRCACEVRLGPDQHYLVGLVHLRSNGTVAREPGEREWEVFSRLDEALARARAIIADLDRKARDQAYHAFEQIEG